MEREEVVEQCRSVVLEHLERCLGTHCMDVVEDAMLVEDLELDELDLVEIIIELEERFDIDILNEGIRHMDTFGDIVQAVVLRV